MVIQEGVRKKFFREAPVLGWFASSRFRGRNKYLDAAHDRMPADSGEGIPAEAPDGCGVRGDGGRDVAGGGRR